MVQKQTEIPAKGKDGKSHPRIRCFICGMIGHRADQCPQYPKTLKEKKKETYMQVKDSMYVMSSDEVSKVVSTFQQHHFKEVKIIIIAQKDGDAMDTGIVLLNSASSCSIFGE